MKNCIQGKATSQPPSTTADNANLSKGAVPPKMIGVIVGVVLGVVLLGVIIVIVVILKCRKSKRRSSSDPKQHQSYGVQATPLQGKFIKC